MVDLKEYNPLTHAVIGCAMRVHRALGPSFPEIIYQRALVVELSRESIAAQREVALPVYYRLEQVGSRRVDFLVDSRVIVELKAVSALTVAHQTQVLNYLESFRIPVGLLLNFGSPRLEYKRLLKSLPG